MDAPVKYSNLCLEIPTAVIQINELEIVEELNEHGIAQVKLLTDDKDKCDLINRLTASVEVKITFMDNGEPTVIFIGLPTKVMIKDINSLFYVELELKSKSFILDWEKKKKRSFQNKDNPFSNLFNQIVKGYEGASIHDVASNGAVQNESIIQYQETSILLPTKPANFLKPKSIMTIGNRSKKYTIPLTVYMNIHYTINLLTNRLFLQS